MSFFDQTTLTVIRAPSTLRAAPYIPLVPGSWYETNVFDFQAFEDPSDATRMLCYASGEMLPLGSTNLFIGRFHAAENYLCSWTDDGKVLDPTPAGWDQTFVRTGSCFYEAGTYYLFYSGSGDGQATEACGLATSTDGLAFTKFAGNPILTATGNGRNDGTHVSQPFVLKEGSSWTMIYSYRNTSIPRILPGFRYATSSDGTTWTKGGSGDILTTFPLFGEGHQLIKFGASDYVLIYDTGNTTTEWTINAATAPAAIGPYTNWASNPLLAGTGVVGTWDRFHVATGYLVKVQGVWRFFYQGAGDHDQPYTTNTWPGSVAAIFPSSQGWLRL